MSVSLNPAHRTALLQISPPDDLPYPCSPAVLQVQEGFGDWNCIYSDGNICRKVMLQNPDARPRCLTVIQFVVRHSRPSHLVYRPLNTSPGRTFVENLELLGYRDGSIRLFVKLTEGSYNNTAIKSYFDHHHLTFLRGSLCSDTIGAHSHLEMKTLFQIVSSNNEIPQEAAILITEIIESSPCDPVPESAPEAYSHSTDSGDPDASSCSSSFDWTDSDAY